MIDVAPEAFEEMVSQALDGLPEVAHHFGISDPRLRELGW
ncbi:MAG: metallopeptidase family protein [Streptosporangiaceae bacterium]